MSNVEIGKVKSPRKVKVVRPCGDCTICCDVLPIYEIGRDWDEGCEHCKSGKGCTVYAERAKLVHKVCETYTCAWTWGLGKEEDRPDRSGFLVDRRKSAHGHGLHALQVCPSANRETLNRMCDDAKEPIYHTTRKMELIETWLS